LVVIGVVGICLFFFVAKRHADQLNEQIADIQQNQGTFEQFMADDISFSKFVRTFDEDQWQNILNKQGQNFVARQWVLASSIIVTLSGGLVLGGFFSVWFFKLLARFGRNLSSRLVVLYRKNTRSSRKRFGGLCWTSKDVARKKDVTNSHVADTDAVAAVSNNPRTKPAEPAPQLAFQKCQSNQALKTKQQKISVADVPSPDIEEPISVLKDLSEHVSAIREYATLQQGRMEKLQDGYDWNIIRTFCLRIIRCIDNIDLRIKLLETNNVDVSDLQEIHDELVFALESSGVEKFSPDINSDYCGQEKKLEAIKEKVTCQNPSLNGKVAEVVRCGYYHLIEGDNIKIIRPSQVKLFGMSELKEKVS
jgi:molecular chaperone GrpE (heat shock protein)